MLAIVTVKNNKVFFLDIVLLLSIPVSLTLKKILMTSTPYMNGHPYYSDIELVTGDSPSGSSSQTEQKSTPLFLAR
jgi:hypothetical protein